MSALLRVYGRAECDEAGVPLGWERCRTCEGSGANPGGVVTGAVYRGDVKIADLVPGRRSSPCETCGGHGSLKAAALADKVPGWVWADGTIYDSAIGTYRPVRDSDRMARCEGCGHPMSDGTWGEIAPALRELPGARMPGRGGGYLSPGLREEGPFSAEQWQRVYLMAGEAWLRGGAEPHETVAVHWSPCDEGCRHGGPGRSAEVGFPAWTQMTAEEWKGLVSLTQKPEASWRAVDVRTLDWAHDLRPESLAVLCLRCFAAREPAEAHHV